MTPFIIGSVLLHGLFVAGMIWGGIRFTPKQRPLPSATVVHLVRPAAPAAAVTLPIEGISEPVEPRPKKRLVEPPKKKPKPKPKAKAPPKRESRPAKKPTPKAEKLKGSGGDGRAISGSAGTMRVGEGFTHDWYLALIQSKIEQNFRPPPGRRRALMTIMEFRISRRGEIVGMRRKQSSGDFLFDQAAERAIRAAGRFPPLPANFEASELGINFEFVSNPSR